MKLSTLFASASWVGLAIAQADAAAAGAPLAPIIRKGTELQLNGQRWSAGGGNVYWLGLDEHIIPPKGAPFYKPYNASYPTHGRITEAINIVQVMGGRIIRSQSLGISIGNPLSLWPTLTKRNPAAFDTIDWSVAEAKRFGIRLQIPLIDNYDYYHGGKYVFLRWRGIDIDTTNITVRVSPRVQEFYTNPTIINDFKQYIHYLLTHKNKYTGLTMAEDPTVAIIETGNELSGPVFGDKDVPNSWTNEILTYVKSLCPNKLMMDGTYGVNKTHFAVDVVDIFGNHYYPLDLGIVQADIAAVRSTNRVYQVGEYNWTVPAGDDRLTRFFDLVEAQQKLAQPVVHGDLVWNFYGHNDNCTGFVANEYDINLEYHDPTNRPIDDLHIKQIRQHYWRLQGKEVGLTYPPVPCPGNGGYGSTATASDEDATIVQPDGTD